MAGRTSARLDLLPTTLQSRKSPCSYSPPMTDPTHLTVKRFEMRAEALDEEGSGKGLDDAIADLVRWMDLAHERLTEQDRAALVEVGGVLYREGLRRIIGK